MSRQPPLTPLEIIEAQESINRLWKGINILPPSQKLAMTLLIEGLSVKEVAAEMKVTTSTVYLYQQLAGRKIRQVNCNYKEPKA